MNHEPPYAELGQFLLAFQAIEELLTELIIQITDTDPEYVGALTAELEFSCKARALDVIFTRFAKIHGITTESPHSEFHKLMNKVQKLATRRNEIVHSFYDIFITVDGQLGMMRRPTRLKPSDGLIEQPHEDILHGQLQAEIGDIKVLLTALESYRINVIDLLYQVER